MRIEVVYMAQARDAAGTASESVELADGATVRDLVAAVSGKHGGKLARIVDHPSVILALGDEQAGPDHALRDGDAVTVLAPISGG